ncbi:GLPGLI family protein [Lacinutrix sp. 5H-3-7-4]|uniref:GLPGLI family protein n=1 Tax=Lacinutrix sp. (strain 5H-3-7-4) TaxID=983544 RepID=UPI00020A3994|nr:GLPGLI family protein [Lacinutrix sp. 5H-3-7-4]AEH00944.1 Protein of unknown function, Porph ging [Lacinutrix sp. 5H-3-7-4]
MRKFLLPLIFLFCLFSFGQTAGTIEYIYTKKLGVDYQTVGVLQFTSNYSSFVELSPIQLRKFNNSDEKSIVVSTIAKERPTVLINRDVDSLYSSVSLFNKKYKIKEVLPRINWVIKNKFKNSSIYKCQLATGEFRGRQYSVWFTQDIPLPYGPWKLQGLPGVILEAHDSLNQIIFKAKSIKLDTKIDLEEIKYSKAYELKTFIALKKKIYLEKERSISSKMPRNGSMKLSLPLRKTQKEITYEWEAKNTEN